MTREQFDFLTEKINNNTISETELNELSPYKVDNAVILAAGFGMRTMPLSRFVPKGLFKVKNEVLIERQIKQLKESGIDNIIIVVGYLKEQFAYLTEKYGVTIINNEDYYRYNNISSLYVVKEYLGNSYISCADLYFLENPFKKYVFDSYYACKYTEDFANEDCVMSTEGDYITEVRHGGEKAWYLIGEAYFSNSFSKKMVELMEEEYQNENTRKMIWDSFYAEHISELKMMLEKCSEEQINEFDSLAEFEKFDSEFAKYKDEILEQHQRESCELPDTLSKYNEVIRYNSATTVEHEGRLHLNENTFGPSPKCLDVLKEVTIQDLYEYDMEPEDCLIKQISDTFSIPKDDIFIHNGSAEIIKSIISLSIERDEYILVSDPGWSYYGSVAKEKFGKVVSYELYADDYSYQFNIEDLISKARKYNPKVIIINSPHNPTGAELDEGTIEKIIKENPNALVYLDQAYYGLSDVHVDVRRLVETYTNLIVTRTLSKYYGLAGIRVGFGFCNSNIKRIFELDLPLFKESVISRRMACVALADAAYYEKMSKELMDSRRYFIDSLNSNPNIKAYESGTNFVLIHINDIDMSALEQFLRENGIRIRVFSVHGESMARIAIANKNVMDKCYRLIVQFVEK